MALSNGLGRATVEGGKSLSQLKDWFFDRDKVQRAADAARLRVLSRFGAFVRRRAQTSMRRKDGPSAAGQPPHAHGNGRQGRGRARKSRYTGAWLRELLFFSYDRLTGTVVVGPLGFKAKGGASVPALHEFGGTRPAVEWKTVAGKRVPVPAGTARYPPRPFMRPALAAELPKFAGLFRGTIGG